MINMLQYIVFIVRINEFGSVDALLPGILSTRGRDDGVGLPELVSISCLLRLDRSYSQRCRIGGELFRAASGRRPP